MPARWKTMRRLAAELCYMVSVILMGCYNVLMGFYSVLMGFYSVLMGFYSVLIGEIIVSSWHV